MNQMFFFFNKKSGQIALLITLIILFAILSIGAGLTLVTIKEMRMAKNIEESAKAIAAANTGMEFALCKTGDDPPGLDEPLDDPSDNRLCSNGWISLSNGSEYCLKYTGSDAKNPESITSIGKSGDVRRAIFSRKENLDNFNNYVNWENWGLAGGYDLDQCYSDCDCNVCDPVRGCSAECVDCNIDGDCTTVGGVSSPWPKPSDKLAQTFRVDTAGNLTQITVWSGHCDEWNSTQSSPPASNQWQMELRKVRRVGAIESVKNDPPGDNPEDLLTQSNTLFVHCGRFTDCPSPSPSPPPPGQNCYRLDFVFSSPYYVTAGERYAFVVKLDPTTSGWDLRSRIRMMSEGVYLPGRAWWSDAAGIWQNDCFGLPCPNEDSDIMFEVYIAPPPGGSFEEVRP